MRFAAAALRALELAGWKIETPPPNIPKYVCLGVPHTSNWDGVLLLLVGRAIDVPIAWMIKDSWMRGPMRPLLESLGAVAINRSRSTNLVAQMVHEFDARDRFVLVIPPEGTRSRVEHWKSGFYNIALGAKVPVVPSYLDFGSKRVGFGPPIDLTGDVGADMDRIRAFYESCDPKGCRHEDFGPIRLKSEA